MDMVVFYDDGVGCVEVFGYFEIEVEVEICWYDYVLCVDLV